MLVIFFPITTHKMQKQAKNQSGTRSWNRSQPVLGPGLEILELVQPGQGPVFEFLDPVQPGPRSVPQKSSGDPIVLSPNLSPHSQVEHV